MGRSVVGMEEEYADRCGVRWVRVRVEVQKVRPFGYNL
jgi:hypothetical protein